MAQIWAKVERLDWINRRLLAMPAHVKREMRVALDKSADELVAMQQRLVPVDTGALRESIRKRDGEHELEIKVTAGDRKAYYAAIVEFGDHDTAAQPYFFVAYRTQKKRIRGRASRAAGKAVKASR
jgi:HK97 gp10 family phage protein